MSKQTDSELERLTGKPHIDGWPLYSGIPPAAVPRVPLDCRLCENYTAASCGCTSLVRCVDGGQYRPTPPRQYWDVSKAMIEEARKD